MYEIVIRLLLYGNKMLLYINQAIVNRLKLILKNFTAVKIIFTR